MLDAICREAPEGAAARLADCSHMLSGLRERIAGTLPIAAAEAQMDNIEDHLDAIRDKLRAASKILEDAA